MDNTIFAILIIATFLAFALMIFGLFAIGFLIGYKIENLRVKKRIQHNVKKITDESREEKKAKKEWRKFLAYDGSVPSD